MLTQALWWTGNALLIVLLVRAITGKFLTKYPVFYFYLGWVFLLSFLSFYLYLVHPRVYESFYWYTEFLSIALGYCVIWEIHARILADYPGVDRMAKTVLLAVFILVVTIVFTRARGDDGWAPALIPVLLERNLRTVQAVLLVNIVGLLIYYTIPVGRNIKGMISGYGVFVGASVANLTLGSHLGDRFQPWWQYLQPTAYLLALLIWAVTLWSYAPNPKPETGIELEEDYQLASAQVEKVISQARSYLVKAVRP